MVIVVCPEVNNEEMADEIIKFAKHHVKLIERITEDLPSRLAVKDFIFGWDNDELQQPILQSAFPKTFKKAKFFRIIDFNLDGSIKEELRITKAEFYYGVVEK